MIIAGSGIGTYLKTWMKNQFKMNDLLDDKYNNVLTHGNSLVK